MTHPTTNRYVPPTEQAPPAAITAADISDDRGMEMLARLVLYGAAVVAGLTIAVVLWRAL